MGPPSGDQGGGCLRGRPMPGLESSPPSVHQAPRDMGTAQATWDRLRGWGREAPGKAEVLGERTPGAGGSPPPKSGTLKTWLAPF